MSKTISEPMEHSTQVVHLYCTDTNTISKRTETRFHMTLSARSSIGCIQDNFRADGTIDTNCATILRQDYHYLQTESNKLPLEHRHLGESLGASKMISVPMVRSVQAVLLYCTDTNTIPKQTEMRFHMTHSPWSSSGASKTISKPMVHSTQTVHLSCVKMTTISKRTQTSFHLSLVTLEYHWVRPKMISKPMVRSVQAMHLYCTDTDTVSKRTETRFHMTHSPWSSIGCVQYDF
jgi:hypothetical protein